MVRIVLLPELFRVIGKERIPQAVLARGYLPKVGPQAAVFGEVSELSEWRQVKGLAIDEYPVHEASMGAHIDVYGGEVERVVAGERVEDFMEFVRSRCDS